MSATQRRDIPRYGKAIIETHCHLDYLAEGALPETLRQAQAVGGRTRGHHCRQSR